MVAVCICTQLYVMVACTLGPSYNEFGYNEHPAVTRESLCVKIIDSKVKKFGYNEQLYLHLFFRL